MNYRNLVAKHMNTYNRATVELDKRSKYLDDAAEQDIEDELKEEDEE